MTGKNIRVGENEFKHIVRLLNTNLEGRSRILHSITNVKGIGRRMAQAILEKAGIDVHVAAGVVPEETLNEIKTIVENPEFYNIPKWFFNNIRDRDTGKDEHIVANALAQKMRIRLDRLKKIKCVRGIRHFMGYKVRGQRMKNCGRKRPQQKLGILKKYN